MIVLPQLDAAAEALAALDPRDPEPGEVVRCAVCDSPRLAWYTPGVMRCPRCRSVAAFFAAWRAQGAAVQRIRCRRRCPAVMSYLTAGAPGRPAVIRCAECGEERPAAFEVGRYGVIQAGERRR